MAQLIATIEIPQKEGRKEIKAAFCTKDDLMRCQPGKVVLLKLRNKDQYSGYFVDIVEDEIGLKAFISGNIIRLKIDWVEYYFEEMNQ